MLLILFTFFCARLVHAAATNLDTRSDGFIEAAQKWMQDNLDDDILKSVNELDIKNFNQLTNIQATAQDKINQLEAQIRDRETKLKEEKSLLENIQQQIKLLKLTPSQLSEVEKYNTTIKHDPKFGEWITEHQTWFEIQKDICIALLFLGIGRYTDSKWKSRSKTEPKTATKNARSSRKKKWRK